MSCKDFGEHINKEQAMTREGILVDQSRSAGSGLGTTDLACSVRNVIFAFTTLSVNENYAEG